MAKNSIAQCAIVSGYTGLSLYNVQKKIPHDFPEIGDRNVVVKYTESDAPRFTVLMGDYNPQNQTVFLLVASGNPIRHLPSNYQSNEFLRSFLMIFQHIFNSSALTLDNIHEYVRPMESPASFLPVLADWLGIHLDTLGGEGEVRQFLQYAIPLYRYRGTALGLRAHLAIVSGVVPEILEGETPYRHLVIHDSADVSASLFDSGMDENCFTIFFPVFRSEFDDTLVQRVSLIVQHEKPVHTRAYISFKQPKKKKRQVTTIGKDNANAEGIIFI